MTKDALGNGGVHSPKSPQARRQRRQRAVSKGLLDKVRKGLPVHQAQNSENLTMIRDMVAAEQRAANPVEQAKTHLRKRGFIPVFSDGFGHHVGRSRIFTDDAQLIAFAREKGFQS